MNEYKGLGLSFEEEIFKAVNELKNGFDKLEVFNVANYHLRINVDYINGEIEDELYSEVEYVISSLLEDNLLVLSEGKYYNYLNLVNEYKDIFDDGSFKEKFIPDIEGNDVIEELKKIMCIHYNLDMVSEKYQKALSLEKKLNINHDIKKDEIKTNAEVYHLVKDSIEFQNKFDENKVLDHFKNEYGLYLKKDDITIDGYKVDLIKELYEKCILLDDRRDFVDSVEFNDYSDEVNELSTYYKVFVENKVSSNKVYNDRRTRFIV